QSQARSQSTGDLYLPYLWGETLYCFNLRREANPLATWTRPNRPSWYPAVSISGEKPIHWRQQAAFLGPGRLLGFNLRRQANPLATVASDVLIASHFKFSISGEKPIHWRLLSVPRVRTNHNSFNLRREANPLATRRRFSCPGPFCQFQSQARSQSTG